MNERETVAVLGLGAMGGNAAQTFVAAGYRTIGFDPQVSVAERAAAAGVSLASSAADAVSGASYVFLSLPTPAHVRSVVVDISPMLAAGAVVVDLSTIDPATAAFAAAQMEAVGAEYLDAPVLGRPERVGSWTCVVGGTKEGVARVEATLRQTIAAHVVHVGGPGAGSLVKVLNNLMFGAINAITAEVLVMAAAAGLDPGVFVDTVKDSDAASVSGLFREIAPRIVDGDFSPTFAMALLHKDNQLAMDIADAQGVPLVVGRSVQLLNTMAMRAGVAADDSGAVIKVYERLMGVDARRARKAPSEEPAG